MEKAKANYITQAVKGSGSFMGLIQLIQNDNSMSWLGIDTDGTEILCKDEETAEFIGDLADEFYDVDYLRTGYYDPVMDAKDGICDRYTGMYYVDID